MHLPTAELLDRFFEAKFTCNDALQDMRAISGDVEDLLRDCSTVFDTPLGNLGTHEYGASQRKQLLDLLTKFEAAAKKAVESAHTAIWSVYNIDGRLTDQ